MLSVSERLDIERSLRAGGVISLDTSAIGGKGFDTGDDGGATRTLGEVRMTWSLTIGAVTCTADFFEEHPPILLQLQHIYSFSPHSPILSFSKETLFVRMPLVVCLCGKRGHGKSTLAQHLKDKYGFQELSFAGPLKKGVGEIFGFSDHQLYDAQGKETVDPFWKVTPREVLQICGTELFRQRLPELIPSTKNIWIKALVRQLQNLPENARVVISDCRFPDEWKAMMQVGARMIRVVRPGFVADPQFSNHPSETSLDNVDLFTPDELYLNDSTVKNLLDKFDNRVQSWVNQPHFPIPSNILLD